MKIRTDFVTNSSSSSYCAIVVKDGQSHRFELQYQGFYTFWFHDPEEKLAECKSVDDLKNAIVYALGGGGIDGGLLDRELGAIADFDKVASIEMDCHEEIEDRGWDDPWPRDVRYAYDFKTGVKTAYSDCPWQKYKGYGDALAPEARDLQGNQLPFFVEEQKGFQCVLECDTEEAELAIPEIVLIGGVQKTIQGLGQGCFDFTENVRSITLPRTIEYIASDALEGCADTLERVRIGDVEVDEPYVVKDGPKLNLVVFGGTEFVVPDDIVELGESAFGGCWNLQAIVLHDGMKKPTKAALSSSLALKEVVLSDGSSVRVADDDSKKCFTISKGVIGFNYEKCAGFMLETGNADDFKWAVDAGGLSGDVLDGFYAKIKMKRKPEFKAMKEFLIAKGAKK